MAVAFDAVSSNSAAGSVGTTVSWTHTPSGTPTAVAVLLENYEGIASVSSVTYGGTSMVQAVNEVVPSGGGAASSAQIWGLANPSSGAQTVVVTYTTVGVFSQCWAVTVTGSNTSSCFRTSTGSNATSGSPSTTLSGTISGDLVVDIAAVNTYPSTSISSAGSGQTQRGSTLTVGGNQAAVSTKSATTTSTTMSWTLGASAIWGQAVAAFYFVPTPTPVNTGPFKRTGIPKLKHGHPLAAGLLYYRFDTGLGFDVNLCPGAAVNSSPIAPPPGVWWNTSVNTPQQYNFYLNPPVIMTPYGAAGYFYQNAGAGNSGNPGSVTNPGIQSWMDFNFPEVPWFNNAQNLYNLGTGAGFSFACGMLHKGTAIAQTSGGSGNPVGPGIGGWITGREDYAAEAGSYVQYGFYKGTSQANTIWCQLMNGPASSPGYTLVGSSGYTSTPNAYTTLSCTVLNTTGTAGSGNGSGTATFYAQGAPVATQTSVNLCTRLGNGENQVCKGSIYHPGTGSSLVTLDGVVYWDAAWSRALTPEENQLLATNPYCLLEWPDDSLKNTIFLSSGGNTYTISAAEGTYTLTGKTQAINAFRSIIATEGVYSLTGAPQTFGIGIGASQGSYSLTGEPQAFAIVMPVSEGVYALTGEAVTLTTSSSPTLVAAEGTYSLVGEPQKFAVALSCLAQHGVYVLTGKPQVLSLNRFGAGGGQSGGHKFIADMGNQTESNF